MRQMSPDSYGPGIIPGLRPWEYPLPPRNAWLRGDWCGSIYVTSSERFMERWPLTLKQYNQKYNVK